jgi:hypothetical protein
MSTAIIISIVVFFLLILIGVGIYFTTRKKDEETPSESDSSNDSEASSQDTSLPDANPSSSLEGEMVSGGGDTWNPNGNLICGMSSRITNKNNVFCTDFSKDNKFVSMSKDCIDIDVDQQNKRVFCIDRKTKKVSFVTIPEGLEDKLKKSITWSNIPSNIQFNKISVSSNGEHVIAIGIDNKVYRYNSQINGWEKQGELNAQEIAALPKSTNIGYIVATNVDEPYPTGLRVYGYGIGGSQQWFTASNWSGTKIDAGNSPNENQPVVCHINKKNDVYCQTTTKSLEKINLPTTDKPWNNINVSGEGHLFLTDTNNNVYFTDLTLPKTGEFYGQSKLSGLAVNKIAA